MSRDIADAPPDSIGLAQTLADPADGPLADLPRLSSLATRLGRWVGRLGDLGPLATELVSGPPIAVGPAEVLPRRAGQGRSGVVATLAWTRLGTRVGLGIETPVAHAIVDGLLGSARPAVELIRPVTPVEWGVLGFVVARALTRLDARPGPLGPWDLSIDRVGPDPFDPRDLGPIVTVRWPVRVGEVSGSARLWVAESILSRLGDAPPSSPSEARPGFAGLASTWRAEAGTIALSRGLARLKRGVVLPLGGSSLGGTVATPTGTIALTCRDLDGLSRFDSEAAPGSSAGRIVLTSGLVREPTPREPIIMNSSPTAPSASPSEVPVTLVVELGRVSLTLSRLADLKPGDLIDLGRHSREPVELTSNGRLVARGELVQVDTELGVRITNVLI